MALSPAAKLFLTLALPLSAFAGCAGPMPHTGQVNLAVNPSSQAEAGPLAQPVQTQPNASQPCSAVQAGKASPGKALSNWGKASLFEAKVSQTLNPLLLYTLTQGMPSAQFVALTDGKDPTVVQDYCLIQKYGETVYAVADRGTDVTDTKKIRDVAAMAPQANAANDRLSVYTDAIYAWSRTVKTTPSALLALETFNAMASIQQNGLKPLLDLAASPNSRALAQMAITLDIVGSDKAIPDWNTGTAFKTVGHGVQKVMDDASQVQNEISSIVRRGTRNTSQATLQSRLLNPLDAISKDMAKVTDYVKESEFWISYRLPVKATVSSPKALHL